MEGIMLSYSACSTFYKCPCMFHLMDEMEPTKAMELGSNIDYMLNVLLTKLVKGEKQEEVCERLGFSKMIISAANNNELCEMFNVPPMIKEWYVDFLSSGYEVLDVQPHFIIEELDYHGYADALLSLDGQPVVLENKSTGKYYDKFFSSKKHSMQAIGYALGLGANAVRYQFFNTRNLAEYCSASKFITEDDVTEFKNWVQFVKDNEHRVVRNTEWCSNNQCYLKEVCLERD